jgi:hypothetical protein
MYANFSIPQEDLQPSHVVSGLVGQVEIYGPPKSGQAQSGPAPSNLFVSVNLWQQLTGQGDGVLFRILFEGEEAQRVINLGVKTGHRLRARLDGVYPKAYATGEGQAQRLVPYLEGWGNSAVLLA